MSANKWGVERGVSAVWPQSADCFINKRGVWLPEKRVGNFHPKGKTTSLGHQTMSQASDKQTKQTPSDNNTINIDRTKETRNKRAIKKTSGKQKDRAERETQVNCNNLLATINVQFAQLLAQLSSIYHQIAEVIWEVRENRAPRQNIRRPINYSALFRNCFTKIL